MTGNDNGLTVARPATGPGVTPYRDNLALPEPTLNVYRLKVIGSIEEQVTVTTFFYQDASPIGPVARSGMIDLVTVVQGVGMILPKMLDCLAASWTLKELVCDSPTFPVAAPYVLQVGGAGTDPSDALATQMAAVLIKRTAFKGQCGRGRFSLPAVPNGKVTHSTITQIGKYVAFAQEAIAVQVGASTVQYTPVLFSRNGSHAHPGKMGVAPLQSVTLNLTLGTIRRRKLGVGV